jgi:uncharacterized protein (DUF2336 family)
MLAITEETTPDDLLRSLDGPNWTERAKSVERIAALYCEGGLDPAMQRRIEDAFRALRYDGEDLVRRLLAECLKEAACLPRDIAFSLATDKPEIAVPFLAQSPSLSDRDLLVIARDHAGPHRLSIARRQMVSPQVSDAVCRCGSGEAILAVLSNDGAAITEATLHWLLEEAPSGAGIAEAIARRKLLPIGIGERLRGGRAPSESRAPTTLGRAAS